MSKKSSINNGAWQRAGAGYVNKDGLRGSYSLNAADRMQASETMGEPSFILVSDSRMGHGEPTQPGNEVLSQALIDKLNAPAAPAAFIFHPGHTCHFSNVSEPSEVPRVIGAADLALMGALAQLPPGHWQVFALHDVQGYEHMEIPALWGVSVGNS